MITMQAHGVDRYFRLTVPSSEIGTKLPIVLAFHGGGGAEENFPQQDEFDALAEQEKFIMAYVISEEGRTESEGEWFLNSAATSRDDNIFSEAIIDELSKSYCIDERQVVCSRLFIRFDVHIRSCMPTKHQICSSRIIRKYDASKP